MPSTTTSSPVRSSMLATLALALLATAPLAGVGVPITSVNSGDWNDVTTWSTGTVPQQDDDVTIEQFHTVSQDISVIDVASLTIDGTLTSGDDPVCIDTPILTVESSGEVSGDATYRSVEITNSSGTFGLVTNNGSILAGVGDASEDGGSVTIEYLNGKVVNHGNINGSIGKRGGSVIVRARQIDNGTAFSAGQIMAGAGWEERGGDAWIEAHDHQGSGDVYATNYGNSRIEAGQTDTGPSAGDASLLAPDGTATNTTNACVKAYCPGGNAVVVGAITINQGKTESCQIDTDPPLGIYTGATLVTAQQIDMVAGESLVIGNLTNQPAFDAGDDIEIVMAPGGVLDLRNNQAGFTRFLAANSITVKADTILLDPGVTLADIMTPTPTVSGGERYTHLHSTADMTRIRSPGETVTLNFTITSGGNALEFVDYTITDSSGWLVSPVVGSAEPLPAASSIVIPVTVTVPPGGGSTTFDLSASTLAPGTPEDSVTSSVVLSDGEVEASWPQIGPPLAGTQGDPSLVGLGALEGNTPFSLTLTNALPSSLAFLILGLSNLSAPFKGGVLVPSTDVILSVLTDGTGSVPIAGLWPPGLPGGVSLYWQYWIPDPAAIFNFASSNGVVSTTP